MPGKDGKSSTRAKGHSKVRRTGIKRAPGKTMEELRAALRSPMFGWGVISMLLFIIGGGLLAAWTREQPLVAIERVMNQTRTVRIEFEIDDPEATEDKRELARQNTPRVLVAEQAVLDDIIGSLERLPATLAGVETLDQVEPRIRTQFSLTEDEFQAIRKDVANGQPSQAWLDSVQALKAELRKRPMLTSGSWQIVSLEGNAPDVTLKIGNEERKVAVTATVNVNDPASLEEEMDLMVRRAKFRGHAASAVVKRLVGSRENPPQPTFRYDAALSRSVQDDAAANVPTVRRKNPVGTMIFARGQVLDERAYELHRQELREYRQHAGMLTLTLERVGVFGAVAAIGVAGFGYLALYCGRVRRNPTRMFGIVGLMLGALLISCVATVLEPRLIAVTSTAPVILLAVIVVVAYDQRLAISLGMLQGLLTVVALREPPATVLTIMLGVGAAVWQLEEIRDRQTLIKMGAFVAGALAIGTVAAALLARPLVPEQLMQTIGDASWAGIGGLAVGAVALSLLSFSFLERAFDIATGMTLIELRDPKQALLRQLQRQAPGTYNHSLNVASIAEAAADSIGANALLTYVGGLYHDIGKMNKPEYFVENQSGGKSKHEKLSPAMSLLVIVGHVKDGLEMAREFELPRPVQHFIEAHHGTTLVEFFFHRAKEQAEADEMMEDPSEIEYRYPGPKPRTKEVAILMLADAVESATRSMSEPTPARIDQLVRDLANKRLLDGQFDECDLTLKDLRKITESISKTVASIYHGRIAYPKGEKKEEKKEERRA